MNGLATTLLLVGLVFFACGLFFYFFPPKKINYFYGYRTGRSMRNTETWKAGNKFSAKIMAFLGLDLLILGAVSYFLFPDLGEESAIYAVGVILLASIILIASTEIYLHRKFDKQGNPRS